MDLDFDIDVDLNTLTPDNVDFSFFEPLADNDLVPPATPHDREGGASGSRPYHSKRPHKKSRAGCKQCKARKVKCDEARPACRACTLRQENCVYPTTGPTHVSLTKPSRAHSSAGSRSSRSSPVHTPSSGSDGSESSSAMVLAGPVFRPQPMTDMTDMKMLWFYTTETWNSFNIEGGNSPKMDQVLRVRVVEHAFASPFLMECLMGLSALQLKRLNQEVPHSKAVSYRARAFEGYRSAIEAARPEDFPALLACSLFMCALSTEMFRDPDSPPLFIIEWMIVWRGIGLIVDMISPQAIAESGLAVLFYRPPINLDKSAKHVPNNLLFMISSIKPGDSDYEHQQLYYEALRYLGSLYMELQQGFSPLLDLRVITFFTFMPRAFIPLAKEHRPRALIIIAHYCAFTKICRGPWWILGIGSRQIREICESVGDDWTHHLNVPRKVMNMTDRIEIAKSILENDHWTAPDVDLYSPQNRDPRVKQLGLITDKGQEATIVDGRWQLQPAPIIFQKLSLVDSEYMMPAPDPVEEDEDKEEDLQDDNTYDLLGKGHPLNNDPPSPVSMGKSPTDSASTTSPVTSPAMSLEEMRETFLKTIQGQK
ncbi:hypothetical protein BX600DRAFT_506541 [Xylariales sp. PMI_506]|nr:hypothetical protein BX600DRAFT_506541 [Xylariales sp. PMI_506]